jgi:DNA polymerase-3 subunit gamma/tau
VIDLAGFYRSLLLLKSGVTKESLLGYNADRFSAKAREKLSAAQLEEALTLLLGLYRALRYSISPRFELETVVSKLCWLDRWVSQAELRDAIEAARAVLDGAKGSAAYGAVNTGAEAHSAGSAGAPSGSPDYLEPGAFAESFKQKIAQSKESVSSPIGEEVETVKRVFRGTIVETGDGV